uniref:Uncharacterized protein n=1 Tax=Heterorhabditis bacteriophora TaxID=37862 RepID=A0A1I7X0T3_HETBA
MVSFGDLTIIRNNDIQESDASTICPLQERRDRRYAVQATNGLESQVHSEGNSPPLVFSRKDSVEVGMTKGCSKVDAEIQTNFAAAAGSSAFTIVIISSFIYRTYWNVKLISTTHSLSYQHLLLR